MDNLIGYLKRSYDPVSIIIYGSYADGTNNLNSDFDALVISNGHIELHDTSFLDGIQLDVFVYPESCFAGEYDCRDFIQILDGNIVLDTDGKGAQLKQRVMSYFDTLPHKSDDEIKAGIDWCTKMLARTRRGDAEGMFRWHWVLTDSLEIFCDAAHHIYLGPKKTLKWMEVNHPDAFEVYQRALSEFSEGSLSDWILYLQNML